jgi:hypothetical protein
MPVADNADDVDDSRMHQLYNVRCKQTAFVSVQIPTAGTPSQPPSTLAITRIPDTDSTTTSNNKSESDDIIANKVKWATDRGWPAAYGRCVVYCATGFCSFGKSCKFIH